MANYNKIAVPQSGEKITIENGKLNVPDNPIIPFIEGDGIGPDIWKATQFVLDSAVEKAYGSKKIAWMEIYAGEKSLDTYGGNEWLPEETFDAIREFKVAIKGPLTTPVGGGIRSLNVTLRQRLDLYACVRPVRWFTGVPNPMKNPQDLDVVIYRENSEDIYAGIEWERGKSESVDKIDKLLQEEGVFKKVRFPETANYGLKPVSKEGTARIVKAAINYAIKQNKSSVTIVHKGNIMKFTEGKFKDWGYETVLAEFRDYIITEDELWDQVKGEDGVTPVKKEGAFADLRNGKPAGDRGDRIIVKDRIADAMFQQLLLRPAEYDVIATMNLNGDYLSDACAAQVGGLGMAPGANINYETGAALFEATHGTAPKYAGLDKVNPGSLILSGVMMLEHLGWQQAADLVVNGIEKTISNKTVTYDLARQLEGAKQIKCSEYAKEIVNNMG